MSSAANPDPSVLDSERFPVLDLLKPPISCRINSEGFPEVLDFLRKKWIQLTPEEWVRQHVLYWLINQTGYPLHLLAVERGITLKTLRTDVLGFDREGKSLLLVECKAARVPINEAVMFQAINYNQSLKARFIWLSSGISHQVMELDREGNFLRQHSILPHFSEMLKD